MKYLLALGITVIGCFSAMFLWTRFNWWRKKRRDLVLKKAMDEAWKPLIEEKKYTNGDHRS